MTDAGAGPAECPRDGWRLVLPVLLGIGAFLLFAGPRVLNPENIAWLTRGDAPQHYLGWAFYRIADWTFPLGRNPGFGLELSSSIAYSDSIPLLAVPFKLLDPLLPATFQYFGLWLLACFVLQSVLAWKLVGLFAADTATRLLGAGFFASAPPMLNRMTEHLSNVAHLTLVGHFLILAALWLFLRPATRARTVPWLVLLGAAAAVHFYLFGMVGAFWLADLLRSVSRGTRTRRRAALIAAGAVGLVLAVMWQAGYFGVGTDFTAGGYGHYNLNLLAPVYASGWSHILPDWPEHGGTYEGFSYLGLGVLLLAAVALWRCRGEGLGLRRYLRRERALGWTVLALTLFAVSTTLSVGPVGIGVTLPEPFRSIANLFRSSGRMFWPVYYLMLLGILYLVVRCFRRRHAVALLAGALAIQVADTSAAWLQIRAYLSVPPASQWDSPLTDPFWRAAGARYDTLRRLPPQNNAPGWQDLAAYALRHGMATDSVYMARYHDPSFDRLRAAAAERQGAGRYDPRTLYILDPEAVAQARAGLNPDTDMLAVIDGAHVLAPGWMACADCLRAYDPAAVPPAFQPRPSVP